MENSSEGKTWEIFQRRRRLLTSITVVVVLFLALAIDDGSPEVDTARLLRQEWEVPKGSRGCLSWSCLPGKELYS
ncbi:hypothetical protein TB1_046294 [Malus domestica]